MIQPVRIIIVGIYKTFYKCQSAREEGSLFQLRNLINKRDVHGHDTVTDKFRAHFAFVEDVLDGYICSAFMDYFGMETLESNPMQNKPPPLLSTWSNEDKFRWIQSIGRHILEIYIKKGTGFLETNEMEEMDNQSSQLQACYNAAEKVYMCDCSKVYKTLGHFKRHLQSIHNWTFPQEGETTTCTKDGVAEARASFMKCSLILRDTYDAYQMADGNRIFRNAKFEMLLADAFHHTKYRLWLWRFLAYENALLSPRQAFEYKWNCCSNTNGGIGRNVPNDLLVEMNVNAIKQKLRSQGANVTYDRARVIAISSQVQDDIKQNIIRQCGSHFGTARPPVSKVMDISLIIREAEKGQLMKTILGREGVFANFVDPFQRVVPTAFHKWISAQKQRAKFELI